MKTILAVMCSITVAYASSQRGPSSSSPDTAIREADEAWAKAIASKSVDQTLTFYDRDAVTAGSAMFPARGLPDFRANWATLFARPDFALSWKAERVVLIGSGDIAYSIGTWSNGPNQNGPYLAVWRKQSDGRWKVLIDAAWRMRPAEGLQ
jgi:ketosteroid isomerase-like protein